MIAQQDQNKSQRDKSQRDHSHELSHLDQYQDQSPQAFTSITHHAYINKVFCWIQGGNTKDVIKFFDTFPHLVNNFYSPNNWSPFMYAVRYGNKQLILYFKQKGMKIHPNGVLNNISIIHTAVFTGKFDVLKLVLKQLNCSPNPVNAQSSPLKLAMKGGNHKMVQILVAKGAYYVFYDVMNNVQPNTNGGNNQQNYKFQSLITGKPIHNSLLVEDTGIKDCPIKQTLRYSRIKSIMHLQKYAKLMLPDNEMQDKIDENHKFYPMATILKDKELNLQIIKACIGKGASVCPSSNPESMEIQKK